MYQKYWEHCVDGDIFTPLFITALGTIIIIIIIYYYYYIYTYTTEYYVALKNDAVKHFLAT